MLIWKKCEKIFTNQSIERYINVQDMAAHFLHGHVDRNLILSQLITAIWLPEASSIWEERNCEPNTLF